MASSRLFPQLILVPSNSSSAHLKTHPRLIQNFSTTQLDLSPAHPKIKTLLPFICVKCKDIVGDKVQSDFIVPQFFSFYFKYVSRFPSVSKEANIKIIISLDFRHLDSYPTVTHALIPFLVLIINSLQETIHPRLRRQFLGLISWTAPALAQKIVANPSPPLSLISRTYRSSISTIHASSLLEDS